MWTCLFSQDLQGPVRDKVLVLKKFICETVREMTNEPWNMGQSVSRQGFKKGHVNGHQNSSREGCLEGIGQKGFKVKKKEGIQDGAHNVEMKA